MGFGIAKGFHQQGAKVAFGDFREEALSRAANKIGDSDRALYQQVDVRSEASAYAFLDAAEREFGPATVMVANAGIYPNTPVLDMSQEEWDRVMETNMRGVFLSCQAAARSMVNHNTRGRIITIASGAYQSGRIGASHYCASKAGVVMFTKVLALELAKHRINVNCVAPGLVEVEGEVSPISAEYKETLARSIP